MANVNGRISLSLYDANGAKGNLLTHVQVPDAGTLADASTAIATVATAYRTVGTAGIREGTFSLVDQAVAVAPAADASIGSGAVFDFDNAVDPTIYGLFVPSFLDSLLGPGRPIPIGSGATAAFIATLVGAILGGNFTNAHYVALRAGTKAFRTDRKPRY